MSTTSARKHEPPVYRLVNVDGHNFDSLPCCGIKDPAHPGRAQKRCWIEANARFGLKAKALLSATGDPAGYLEYAPGEYAWRGVDASGYLFIHCVWIYPAHRGKGCGRLLIEHCLAEARGQVRNGLAVVVRKGPWMADHRLFGENEFEVADTAPPDFELLQRKIKRGAPDPKFRRDWDRNKEQYGRGLVMVHSGQCPHSARFVADVCASAREDYRLEPRLVELKTAADAQNAPTPYGTFALLLDGRVLADHPISRTRFRNIMNKLPR